MGAHALAGIVQRFHILGSVKGPTTAKDTQAAAKALLEAGVDLLLVAGGDGTMRDLLTVVGERVLALATLGAVLVLTDGAGATGLRNHDRTSTELTRLT